MGWGMGGEGRGAGGDWVEMEGWVGAFLRQKSGRALTSHTRTFHDEIVGPQMVILVQGGGGYYWRVRARPQLKTKLFASR